MNSRRTTAPLLLAAIIGLLVFATPATAHAFVGIDVIASLAKLGVAGALELVALPLEAVRAVLIAFIAGLGYVVDGILYLMPNDGGAVVYTIWKIFRDICNSLFILFFIVIAFGTIFNAVWKNPYHYEKALKNVILAAIFINFSLPIGQMIIWTGNQASKMILDLMRGSNLSIAKTIQTSGQFSQIAAGKTGIELTSLPIEQLKEEERTIVQKVATTAWRGNAKIDFDNCIKSGAPLAECNSRASRIAAIDAAAAVDREQARIQEARFNPINILSDARTYWGNKAKGGVVGAVQGFIKWGIWGAVVGGAKGAWNTQSLGDPLRGYTVSQQAWRILGLVFNNLLLMVVAISFSALILFLLLRFPASWFYLATSSFAFFQYAIPGSKALREWFRHIIGWSIFAPLYLFFIYIGMFLLSEHGKLIVGMENAGFFSGLAAVPLYYLIVGGVFLGGLKASWTYAFSFSSSLSKNVTAVTDYLGIGQKDMFGAKTLARRAGITPYLEGKQAALKERYEKKFVTPQLRREEEIRARAQGGRALENLQRKRIEERKKANKESARSTADLRSDLVNKGSPEYFAAASDLLENNELTPAEMQEYAARARTLNPAYGDAVRAQINRRVVEMAREKKHRSAADVVRILDMYAPDPRDAPATAAVKAKVRDDLLNAVERNQPLIAADLVALGFYPGKRASDIIKANFSALENKDIITVVERMESGMLTKDSDVEKLIAAKNRKLADHLNLMASTTDPHLQAHILNYMRAHRITARP